MWIVNLVGLLLIFAIVWWFWLYKPENVAQTGGGPITIVVENGIYQPAHIRIPVGQPTTLRFVRKDKTPCASIVQFSALDISAELPLDKPVDIEITPQRPGDYAFSCQMQMYKGTLHVESPP